MDVLNDTKACFISGIDSPMYNVRTQADLPSMVKSTQFICIKESDH